MNNFRSAILSGNGLHPADPVVRKKREHSTEADDLSSAPVDMRMPGRRESRFGEGLACPWFLLGMGSIFCRPSC